MSRQPANCYVIAGPNGAGKTTFATEFLPRYADCRNFINADLIARGLSPFDPDSGLLRAGRLVVERIREFTEASTDFAFETTLAGRAYVPLLRRLRKTGFRLHLFYLWIPSAELALLRIRDRVESGGHNVPERDVRRRFSRSLGNLFKHFYVRAGIDNGSSHSGRRTFITHLANKGVGARVLQSLAGHRHLGTISGVVIMSHHAFGGIGAWLGGMIFDADGDYDRAFLIMLVSSAIAAWATLALRSGNGNGRGKSVA